MKEIGFSGIRTRLCLPPASASIEAEKFLCQTANLKQVKLVEAIYVIKKIVKKFISEVGHKNVNGGM